MRTRSPALAILLLTLLPFLVYAVNIDDYFVGDDFDLIHSFHDKPPSYFFSLLYDTESGDSWTHYGLDASQGRGFIRPVPVWLLKLDSMIWGVNAFGYHLTSHLSFSLVILIVFGVVRTVLGATQPAVLAGTAVALHPLYARVVPWIAGREEITGALLSLGALACLMRHRKEGRRLWGYYVLFALALLTKEWTLSVLGLALAYDLICHRPFCGVRRWLTTHLPALAIALGYLGLRWFAFGNIKGGYGTETAYFSPAAFLEFHLAFLRTLLGPTMLSASWLPLGGLLALLVAVGLIVVAGLAWQRFSPEDRRRVLFFGPVWYLGSTAILHGIDFDPRRCALPVIGLVLFAALLVDATLRAYGKRWRPAVTGALIAVTVAAFLPVSVGHSLKFQSASRTVAAICADIANATASLEAGSSVYIARAPQDELPPYYFGWSLQAALQRPFMESDLADRSLVVNVQNIWMNRLQVAMPEAYDLYLDYPRTRRRLNGEVWPPPPLPRGGPTPTRKNER